MKKTSEKNVAFIHLLLPIIFLSKRVHIAEFLENQPIIKSVHYPELPSYKLKTTILDTVKSFVNMLKVFQISANWDAYKRLVYAPAIYYLKELSKAPFKNRGISLRHL